MDKQSSIIIYTTEDGSTNLQVKMENETIWLSTSQMAELFGREGSNTEGILSMFLRKGNLTEYHMCKICPSSN